MMKKWMQMNDKELERYEANIDWWRDRQGETQAKLTAKNIKDTEKQLKKYYKNSMEEILGQFEKVYLKLLSTTIEGREPTPADLYKLDTYWKMQGQLRDELTKLGDKEAALMSKQFMAQYADIYEAVALKDNLYFGEVSRETALQMINSVWCADGKTWSSRVWQNTEKLREALNDNLIHCVLTGKKTTELKQLLQNEFLVDYNRADTIIRTEMAHIQTEAAKQRYKDSGIKEVEVWADYDERRCDVCGKLHKTKHNINGVMPIPAHPNCRCCVIPVVD